MIIIGNVVLGYVTSELAALDELCVGAHYVVCQYQLKDQFYVTTCSHCFKPCC